MSDPPGHPVFRIAEAADIADVVELVNSAYRGESSRAGWTTEADLLAGQRIDAAMVAEVLAGPDAVVLLAVADGRLLACCDLRLRHGAIRLGMFAVHPEHQGYGLGRAVLARAEKLATAGGCARMELAVISVRADLIAWYLRRGYHPTGEYEPFPYGDERFGLPQRPDLEFTVLAKQLHAPAAEAETVSVAGCGPAAGTPGSC